jgi:ribosomal protein S18 acetylase RimI-like enzyme
MSILKPTFRPITTADIPVLMTVHDACRERDKIDPYSVCYRLPNYSPERYAQEIQFPDATLIAEIDSEIVAHGFMEAWGFDDRAYLWRVWVKPGFRNQGIGTTMLHWGEQKARDMHVGNSRNALHLANATEHEADAVELLQNEGYILNFIAVELAFDALMPVSPPAEIPGITFRSLDRKDSRKIARALSAANLDERINEDVDARIDNAEPEFLTHIQDCDTELSVVAWDNDEVAGAYLCGRRDDVGEISQVAVGSHWRKRGIARSLAMRSLQRLKAAGCKTVRLFTSMGSDEVEPEQGPYAMYRKFGFYPIARHLRFRKPMLPAIG